MDKPDVPFPQPEQVDDRGVAEPDDALPTARLRAMHAEADAIVAEVDWTMALEAQDLRPEALAAIRQQTIEAMVAAASVGGEVADAGQRSSVDRPR